MRSFVPRSKKGAFLLGKEKGYKNWATTYPEFNKHSLKKVCVTGRVSFSRKCTGQNKHFCWSKKCIFDQYLVKSSQRRAGPNNDKASPSAKNPLALPKNIKNVSPPRQVWERGRETIRLKQHLKLHVTVLNSAAKCFDGKMQG